MGEEDAETAWAVATILKMQQLEHLAQWLKCHLSGKTLEAQWAVCRVMYVVDLLAFVGATD